MRVTCKIVSQSFWNLLLYMRCAAYCTATAFEMNGLLNYLKVQYSVTRFRDVLHIPYNPDTDSDVFFFPYGAIVCWGLDPHLERDLLHIVRRFELESVDPIEDDVF